MSDARLMFLVDTDDEAGLVQGWSSSCGGWITIETRPVVAWAPFPVFMLVV